MGKFKDLTGTKFSRLTVVSIYGKDKGGKFLWNCICECGNEKAISGASLKGGLTQSCGCLVKQNASIRFTTHGITKNGVMIPEYQAWSDMKQRCYNKNNKRFSDYGGRGITVCNRWLHSFENFFEDMGRKPTDIHSLDRYPNNDGNYEKNNCRWGTDSDQMNNTRGRVRLVFKGESTYLGKFSKYINKNPETISYHLKRGKTPDQIFDYYNKKGKI